MPPLTVQTVADSAELESLDCEWDELLQSSASNCVFLTWEWLRTWWKHLSAGRSLRLLTVWSGRELVALVPLAARPRLFSAWPPLEHLEFLGTGTVGSDYLDVIARRGWEPEVMETLAAHLGPRPLMLRLAQVRKGTKPIFMLADHLERRGWQRSVTQTDLCPYIPLAGHTWDSYLATFSAKHRYNLLRQLKALGRKGRVHFDYARTEEERQRALTHLFRLHDLRWKGHGGSDAFDEPGVQAFHDEFTSLALQRGWLRLFLLSLDSYPVAALYGFAYDRVFYFYQSGFDPYYSGESVGSLTIALTIKHAIEEGFEEYDFLHGNEPYKFHWAKATRELIRVELYPRCLAAVIAQGLLRWGRAVRRLARYALPAPLVRRLAHARLSR